MVVARNVDQVLRRAVDAGVVPGVVALVANAEGVLYSGTFGTRQINTAAPMSLDTVMLIASMTKAVTSVAAMQLVEQGRIGLNEPVGEQLPELASVQVLEGFDAAGVPRLRRPRRPVTLRHLLTHTAGFAYYFSNADLLRYHDYAGIPTLDTGKKASLLVPLVFDPGERWEYGINTDWVGQLVERLSGQSLGEYFREHIFDPLGMRDTTFLLHSDQQSRLATVHRRGADGSFRVVPSVEPPQPEFFEGGGGLYATGPDYLRFLRMLLSGGQLEGVRVLRPDTVAVMGTNQIGEIMDGVIMGVDPVGGKTVLDYEFFPGMVKRWGLAAMITTQEASTGRAAGSWAWGGAYNTAFWLDPVRRVTGVLLTQVRPWPDAGVMSLFDEFEHAVYAEEF